MPVVAAQDDQEVEAEHVYVMPPGAALTISGGRLKLPPGAAEARMRTPIDLFFTSLAEF